MISGIALRGLLMISDTLCAALATVVCVVLSVHAFYNLPLIVGTIWSSVSLVSAYTTWYIAKGN